MKQVSINTIKDRVSKKYGELTPLQFYDITDFDLDIETPSGPTKVVSFVVKPGNPARVELTDGSIITGSSAHGLTTPNGTFQIKDLKIETDLIVTRDNGAVGIKSIEIDTDKTDDFYDIEVDSTDHLYYTSNGVCHHNTGKTHTVAKILGEMGLSDGAGYFKNTGSASAAGIYSLLFRYKNEIVLFDDSDGALSDVDSRNLIKAATDDKKIRKLVWNKMGKNIADPNEMTDDEILEAGMIPRYFEFTGKIIFISNLPLSKLDPDGALRTRAFVVNIDPTDMEIYDFMGKIVSNIVLNDGLVLDEKARIHVVELLRKSTSKQAPSLRKLSRGLNIAAGAIAAGVNVPDNELRDLIQEYA